LNQADAIALVVKDVQGDLATKYDLKHLANREDLAQVKSEISQVKSDLVWLKWVVGLSPPIMIGAMTGGFSIIASMLP